MRSLKSCKNFSGPSTIGLALYPVSIVLSNIKVMASTESGLAVIICSNGIIVGTNTQAYKYTGSGASALS